MRYFTAGFVSAMEKDGAEFYDQRPSSPPLERFPVTPSVHPTKKTPLQLRPQMQKKMPGPSESIMSAIGNPHGKVL